MFIILVCFLLIALYLTRREYLSRTRRHREYGDKIPGPKSRSIIVKILRSRSSKKSLLESFNSLTKIYGPVSRAWIGPKLVIALADPSSIELVFAKYKSLTKSSLYEFGEPWLGQGLLLNKGETWWRHRKIVAPSFNGPILAQFVDIFNCNLDILTEKLSEHQNGPEFDICPFLYLYALDTICESSMGVKVNAQLDSESEYVKGVHCLESVIFARAFQPWLYSDMIYRLSSSGRQQAKYLPIVLNMTKRVIQERKELRSTASTDNTTDNTAHEDFEEIRYKKRRAFLDYLLDYIAKGAQLTNQELQHEVDTIMFAGHDTTAISLSYTCWLLAKHQHVQDKVVSELKTIFGDSLRHAKPQDLSEMKYLEMVIKESLRVFPPVPLYGRKLTQDVTTDKYVFPAGCEIGVNVYMLHRHPDYFPDPERFDPDRFLPENSVGRHPYCYTPFGAGPRTCLGYKFALHEIKITLSHLLRHFRILPSENPFLDLELIPQIIMKSKHGVRIRLQSRNFVEG